MKNVELGLGGGALTQVANKTPTQMMSYLVDCPDGQVIMIDGGNYCSEEGEDLHSKLKERGGRVSLWIITHAHDDHLGAPLYILEKFPDIKIDSFLFSFPDREWLAKHEDYETNSVFLDKVEELKIPVHTPVEKEMLELGGVKILILSVTKKEEYERYPNNNPTSTLFKLHFPSKEVLFLGDYDKHAEADYLKARDTSALRCDICQMAHHGQGGVTKEFYELIMPKICLYAAPKWLWENNLYRCDDPATAGKGPFETFETRRWMEELGAEASYTQAEGDIIFI